jgi:hypothetical protein
MPEMGTELRRWGIMWLVTTIVLGMFDKQTS